MDEASPFDGNRHHFHYFPAEAFPDSFALISPSEKADTAIVFVHGFGGDACGTWSHFHQMVDDLDLCKVWFAAADLFFFQYASVWERIDSSVDRLLKFIDAIIPEPKEQLFSVTVNSIFPEEQTGRDPIELNVFPATRVYKRVFLVGHSEGGVVIRKAVLDAAFDERKPRTELLEARIALFAPALFGYCPSGFLGTLSGFPGLGGIVDALLSATPAYQDLKDTQGILSPLQEQTEKLSAEKLRHAFRAFILWSRKDHVVKPGSSGKYRDDIRDYVDGGSHTSICKPRMDYIAPISLITSLEKLFP
jgi:pimeloyl-ACP methyl ester carboxylesterase